MREEVLLILFKITTDVWFEMSCLIDVMLSAIRCCFMIQKHHPKRPSRAITALFSEKCSCGKNVSLLLSYGWNDV